MPHGSALPEQGTRRSLVLSGGGMRVAYQAGAIRALLESGLRFHHADATSGGSMNLAMLLSGQSPEGMCERWRTLNVRKFASPMPLTEYARGPKMRALSDADGIVGHVFPHLGIDLEHVRSTRGIQGTFNVGDYNNKTNQVIEHQDIDIDLLVAGLSLPIFMPAVTRGRHVYTDPAWIKDANLWEAVRRGSDEIWLIWCLGNSEEWRSGFFRQYIHMLEMTANGSLFEELERIHEVNQGVRPRPGTDRDGPVTVHVIKPEHPLPLDPEFFMGRVDADTLIGMGYQDAKGYLASVPEGGTQLNPSATKMTVPGAGIAFRELLSGEFAGEAADSGAGESVAADREDVLSRQGIDSRGRENGASGHLLSVKVAVEIADLERLGPEVEHLGRITARLSLPPLGTDLLAREGTLTVVASPAKPGGGRLLYELWFDHDGRELYLVAERHLHRQGVLGRWAQLATLHATLHEGTSAKGSVLGTGVLRPSARSMLAMPWSLRVVYARSLKERACSLAVVGRLIFGGRWGTSAIRRRTRPWRPRGRQLGEPGGKRHWRHPVGQGNPGSK